VIEIAAVIESVIIAGVIVYLLVAERTHVRIISAMSYVAGVVGGSLGALWYAWERSDSED
jgi:hypothetical protein